MSEKYKFRNPEGIYFISPTLVGWVDLFTKSIYRELIVNSLRYCQEEKGLIIHAWCIMSSHLHLIVSCQDQFAISSIVRDFKKYTSKAMIKAIIQSDESRREWLLRIFKEAAQPIRRNTNYKVWQDGNHPVELIDNKMLDERLNYLHLNPVKEAIVQQPDYYIYSSANDYFREEEGILKIEKIE
ncbi:MAG: transposase [Vicingaceae bacterium]